MGFIFNTDTGGGGAVTPGSITDVELATDAVTTDKILAGAVSLDKLPTTAQNTVLMRTTAGTGPWEAKTTADAAAAIPVASVGLDKLPTTAQNTVLMRTTAGTGPWEAITAVNAGAALGMSPGGPITPAPGPGVIDTTGAADSREGIKDLINAHAGEVIHLPPGTIRIGGVVGGGAYNPNGAIVVPNGTTLIGHEYGTTFLCDTPLGSQQYFRPESNVTLENITFQFDSTTATSRNSSATIMLAILINNLTFQNVIFDGGGKAYPKIDFSVSCIMLFGCSDILFQNSQSRYGMANSFGFQLVGCKRVLIENSKIQFSGWDGLKATSGQTNLSNPTDAQFYPTFNSGTGVITSPTSLAPMVVANDHSVKFEGVLPEGLVSNREYYMSDVSGDTFKIKEVRGSSTTKSFGPQLSAAQPATSCTVSGNFFNYTLGGRTPVNGEIVRFAGTTAPIGITFGVDYYVRDPDAIVGWFSVTDAKGGHADVVVTSGGSGVTFELFGPKATHMQYGIAEEMKVVDTELSDNGYALLALQDPRTPVIPTATYTANAAPSSVAYGDQYRLNFSTDQNFTVPAATPSGVIVAPTAGANNKIFHVGKQLNSKGTPYITFQPGANVIHTLAAGQFQAAVAAEGILTVGTFTYRGSVQKNAGGREPQVNETVIFSGGTAPTPLSNGTQYYIVKTKYSIAGYFSVSSTIQGTPIYITAAGSGSYTLGGRDYPQAILQYSSTNNVHPDYNIYRISESANGQWSVAAWGNGEGFDGAGNGFTFHNVTANRNQGPAFQIKPISEVEQSFGTSFVGCRAWDNGSNAFAIVNTTADNTLQFVGNITIDNCEAVGNQGEGFNLTTNAAKGVSIDNSVFRSNRGGCTFSQHASNVRISNCHLLGNGPSKDTSKSLASRKNVSYNMQIQGATNVVVSGCHFSGVDPGFSQLHTAAEQDAPGNAQCRGIFIQKTSGSGTLKGVVLDNNTFHNHYLQDDLVYSDGTELQRDVSNVNNSTTFWASFTPDVLQEKSYPRHTKRIILPNSEARSIGPTRNALPAAAAAGELGLEQLAFELDNVAQDTPRLLGRSLAVDSSGLQTDSCRWTVSLPEEYETGRPVNVCVRCRETLSIVPYSVLNHRVRVKPIGALHTGLSGADLVTPLADVPFLSTTLTTYRHSVTSTGLFPGQQLEVALSVKLTRAAGVATLPEITEVWLEY